MAETFTFEDAQKAGADSFTFEEAAGQDTSGNTVANQLKSIAKPVNIGAGDFLKALAIAPVSMQAGIGLPDPEKIGNLLSGNVVNTPTYKAGEFVSETGEQMDTGKPTLTKKIEEMGGGFLPMVASGPFAPATIGLQSLGGSFDERFKKAKADGKSDAEAAHDAISVGVASGLTQAAIWSILPRPLKSIVGKFTGKVGTGAIAQFMARRAAGAAEGAVLGGTSTAAQNLTTGRPLMQDVGSGAAGLAAVNALMPQPGAYRRPAEAVPAAERGPAGLLGRGTRFQAAPNGKVIDVTEISPFEQAELAREAEAESRQGGSGVERVVNTIDAALRKADEKANTTVRGPGGHEWYKRGSFWVTDSPMVSLDKASIKAGRGNPVEDVMVQDFETRLKAKETGQQDVKTQTQKTIEDVTGASAEQAKKGSAGRTALATREIIENKLWKRFGSPLSEYGDKGQMSQRQQLKISALSDYLAKEPDVDMIERHWQQIKDVEPKYPYDIEYKRLIAERLGHELPEPVEGGDKNAIGEISDKGGTPPEHPGDVEGGAPVRAGGGGGPRQPAPGAAAEKAPLKDRLESPDTFKGRNWTADALQYGAGLDPAKPEQLAELKRLEAEYSQKLASIPKEVENFDEISKVGNQKQWATEAIQGATGLGGSDVARASLPADYKPPFPQPVASAAPAPEPAVSVTEPVGPSIEDLNKSMMEANAKVGDLFNQEKAAQQNLVSADRNPAGHVEAVKKLTQLRLRLAEALKDTEDKMKAWNDARDKQAQQTSHWPDVLKELVLDAPPTGALTKDKFNKPGQPTRQSVIDSINSKLKRGSKPEDIIAALQKARTPSGAISALTGVAVEPVLHAQEIERIRRENMTPAERAVSEKKEADDKARAAANPPTVQELELRAWEKAWSERVPETDKKTQLAKQDIANRELIARMKEKYGTPDPAKYRRQQSGEPPFKPPTGQASSGFKEGDSVAMRDTDGKIYRGVVIQNGGDLWVRTPDDRITRLRDGPWVNSTKIPLEPADFTEYTPDKFRAQLEKEAKVRAKSKVKDELLTALDKMEPGFMERVRKAVQAIRADFTQRSLDPESAGHNLIANVVEAAKAKHFADREFKGREQSHAKLLFERAKEHLLDIEKWANEVLKGGGTHLGPDVLAAYVVKGVSVLARGVVDFAKWSDEMVREYGEKVRPYLKHVYDKSTAKLNEGNLAKNNPMTKWVTDDVAPFLGKQYDAAKAAINFFVNTFSPTTNARPGDVDALFEAKGYKEKVMTRAAAAMEHASNAMGKLSREQQINFVDRIKRGLPQTSPELQQTAELLRRWDDKLYAEATTWKPKLNYLDDHYRVLWKVIPGTAGKSGTQLEQIMSKRPWQGSKGFLLQHTLEDMSDGIHRGGVPVTYNPVEMFLLHAQDVMKFVSANRAFENLKKSGAAEFVERGKDAPEGFTRINDRIAKKYFRTDESGAGEWWIEKGAAQMINNYLSQDWIRQGPFGPIGRALIGLKNLSTMVELGASPFHAVFETNEAVASAISLAVNKMMTSGFRLEGAKEFAKALPGAIPVLGGVIPGTSVPETVRLGSRVERYAKDPDGFKRNFPETYSALAKQYPDLDHMINDLFSGGGKVGMDEAYKTQWIKGLKEAVANNNYVGAVARALPMINEQMLSPIFNIYIPRLKLGTFMREYSFELARRQGEIDSGKTTREKLARETWAFVDDRFGELNWDNLYWNRTFKSFMQLDFRSVTWKLGNTRGFGKAARDFGLFFGEVGKGLAGKESNPRWTQPLGWLAGMAIVTTIQATILSKIFTGKYPWELADDAVGTMKNLTFPRIDKDDASQRISVPTYWKDAVHAVRNPVDYFTSSMSGEIGRVNDIWRNKDFYGTKVYNEDDPFYKRVKDSMQHLIPVPFSYSSYTASKKSGEPGIKAYTGFMGYTKAPYYVSHSAAEVKAAELLRSQLPVGGRTAEQAEKALKEHQAVIAIRRGDMTIDDAIQEGLIAEHQVNLIEKQVEGNHVAYQLRTMSPADSLKVWSVATPQERAVIKDIIEQKIYNNRTLDEAEKDALLEQLNK